MRGEGCAVCHTSSSVKPRRLRVTGVNISQHVSDIRSSFLLPGVSSAPLYLGRGKMGMGWLTFAYVDLGKNTHTHTHTHKQTHTHLRSAILSKLSHNQKASPGNSLMYHPQCVQLCMALTSKALM